MSDQRAPYEDVPEPHEDVLDDTVDLAKREPQPTRPMRPVRQPVREPQPGAVVSRELIPAAPQVSQPWNEARIMRLAATGIATVFIILFVVTAANVLSYYAWGFMWAPFLVGAIPYVAFAALAWRRHLEDESKSRERRENFEQSRLDLTPLADMKANTERYR